VSPRTRELTPRVACWTGAPKRSGIPKDVEAAVDVALAGKRRRLDVGRINGECFAVMAGAGFDARMIAGADGAQKDRFGRLAYLWTGARSLRTGAFDAKIAVDGATGYRRQAVRRHRGLRRRAPRRRLPRDWRGDGRRRVRARFDRKVPYELDGGERGEVRKLRIDVQREAVQVCVPASR
jgi:diacylglycerol kinase family enzyme